MITIDQILLLQEKIESAANKIKQLQAENDALRSKCAELTNALSTKSEQLSSFESEQSKIENGILHAINRLNAIENSVLHSTVTPIQNEPVSPQTEQNPVPAQNENILQNENLSADDSVSSEDIQDSEQFPQMSFTEMPVDSKTEYNNYDSALDVTESETSENEDYPDDTDKSDENSSESDQFDIF